MKAFYEALPEEPGGRGKAEFGAIEIRVLDLWDGFQAQYYRLHPDEKWEKDEGKQLLILGGKGTWYYRVRKKRVRKGEWEYVQIDKKLVPDGEEPPKD